jgi:hypothetical protein
MDLDSQVRRTFGSIADRYLTVRDTCFRDNLHHDV